MILLGGAWAEMGGRFSDLCGTKLSLICLFSLILLIASGRQAAHDPEVEDLVCHQRPGPGVSCGPAKAANLPDQH